MMLKKLISVSPFPKPQLLKERLNLFNSFSDISRKPDPNSLYRRITPVGDPSVSIVPVLDQWIKDGNSVNEDTLRHIIDSLSNYRRYSHALEVSQWMTDQRNVRLSSFDAAKRMKLILRVQGLEQVEEYFANIPQGLRSFRVYLNLLNCYALAKSVDKADEVMQKAKDLGYVSAPVWYNIMMDLHCNLGNYEKIEHLIHEMEGRGISPDCYTHTVRVRAYTAVSDTNGIDSVVRTMESDPQINQDWSFLAGIATGYLKLGSTDKALAMLEKTELLAKKGKRKDKAVSILCHLYAQAGKKDEVYRIWNQYKQNNKVYNNVYASMMSTLMMLEDFDGVESLFNEWESSSGLMYDFKMVNYMIDACCRIGDFEKAEAVLKKGMLNGGKPFILTWCNLAGGYVMGNKLPEAIDSLKKAISSPPVRSDLANLEMLKSCLKYLEEGKNVDEFTRSLNRKSVPSRSVLEKLFNFIKTGELSSCSGDSNEEHEMTDDKEMLN